MRSVRFINHDTGASIGEIRLVLTEVGRLRTGEVWVMTMPEEIHTTTVIERLDHGDHLAVRVRIDKTFQRVTTKEKR